MEITHERLIGMGFECLPCKYDPKMSFYKKHEFCIYRIDNEWRNMHHIIFNSLSSVMSAYIDYKQSRKEQLLREIRLRQIELKFLEA